MRTMRTLRRRYGRADTRGPADVFLSVRPVYPRDWQGSRDPRPPKYVAGWVVRGLSHEVYRSAARATREEATSAAYAWLAKYPSRYRDTTK